MIEIRNAHAVLLVEQPATIQITHVEKFWGVKVEVFQPADSIPGSEGPSITATGSFRFTGQAQTLFLNSGKLQVETHEDVPS